MDNRRLILVMILGMVGVFLWVPITNWIGEQLGYDMSPRRVEPPAPATAPADAEGPILPARPLEGVQPPPSSPVASEGTPLPAEAPPTLVQGLHVLQAEEMIEPVVLGSLERDQTYPLGLRITQRGAALESVTLNEFRAEVRSPEPYVYQQPYVQAPARTRVMGTRLVVINGAELSIADAVWTLDRASLTRERAVYTLTIADATGPVVRLRKTFVVQPRTQDALHRGYEVVVSHGYDNLTDRAVTVQAVINGPTVPPMELERGHDRQIVAGHLGRDNRVLIDFEYAESFRGDRITREFVRDSEGRPMLWAGASSVYFAAYVRPLPLGLPPQAVAAAQYLQSFRGESFQSDPENPDRLVGSTIVTTELPLAVGASIELPMQFFLGPKQRRLLNNDYFGRAPFRYDQTLVLMSGPCAWCTFQWLISVLVVMLSGFHFILRDWGLAIIMLVIVVRVLLHPITKKSQVSMMKMGKMQPEIERLRKKYGDNKEELNKAMMQFYKEQGATPILGCLPMLLQMPIWIALWNGLQSTFELRHAAFLHPFGIPLTWIYDLSKPDHLIQFENHFRLFGFIHISGLNILPILLGVAFYVQMKIQPKPASMTKEQEQQQKIMMWMMPFLFPLFLYGGPAGLNIYILTSTIIGTIESKLIRDHFNRQEELEKQGKVLVDHPPTPKGGGATGKGARRKPSEPAPKPGGIRGWLADLQEKAEELRRQAEKKNRPGRR